MITYKDLSRHAKALLEFCEYPAVEYKVKFSILDVPYEDRALSLLRKAFLESDIVEEMAQTQDIYGAKTSGRIHGGGRRFVMRWKL